jgi:hypothetical protein
LLHPFANPLLSELSAGLGDRLLFLRSSRAALAVQALLQSARALGQPLLFPGKAPKAVGVSLAGPAQIGFELTLRVGELTRFHLEIPARPARFVGRRRLQLALDITKPIERPLPTLAGLGGILSAQIAGRAAHFIGSCPHLLAALWFAGALLRGGRTLRAL